MASPLFAVFWTMAVVGGAVVVYLFSRDQNYADEHGQIAVRQFVERHGQTLVSVKARRLLVKPLRGSLSDATTLFDVVARTADGEMRTYRLAFDAEGGRGENSGLKQYGAGGWRDAL